MEQQVILTGADGFFGKHIHDCLYNEGYSVIPIKHSLYDLTQYQDAINAISIHRDAKYLIHAAAFSGGIAFNKTYPDRILYENTIMSLNVLRAASLSSNITKVVSIISSCAYPDNELLKESEFWNGLPNETIRAFGLQKRNIVEYSDTLNKTTKKEFLCTVFNNLYGPGDSTDLHKTKVVMAVIKKLVDAKQGNLSSVEFWGDGSRVYRQFTYVKDAAKDIVNVLTTNNLPKLINVIKDDKEISIKNLVNIVANLVEYNGKILWDKTKPNGQLHKVLDSMLCSEVLNLDARTDISTGLSETIRYYCNE